MSKILPVSHGPDDAPEAAEIIFGGKRPRDRAIPQEELNQLLAEKAKAGKTVVRLKGGDPLIFGRGGEELLALAEAGQSFEVVPGITSAIAGANKNICSPIH